MIFKIANTESEWKQAFRLLKERFEQSELIQPTNKEYYFPVHFAIPSTTVFVAIKNNKVVATTVTVFDNVYLGLPCETVYPIELEELRKRGTVAEGGSIATDPHLSLKESTKAINGIIRLSFQYFVKKGFDYGIITSHPRHAKFYTKYWGCILWGEEKSYPERQNKLVQGYLWTKEQMESLAPAQYKATFETAPVAALDESPIPVELVHTLFGYKPASTGV